MNRASTGMARFFAVTLALASLPGSAAAEPGAEEALELATLFTDDGWGLTPRCIAWSPQREAFACQVQVEAAGEFEHRAIALIGATGEQTRFVIEHDVWHDDGEGRDLIPPTPERVYDLDALREALAEGDFVVPAQPAAVLDSRQRRTKLDGGSRIVGRFSSTVDDYLQTVDHEAELELRCRGERKPTPWLRRGGGVGFAFYPLPETSKWVVLVEEVSAGEGLYESEWSAEVHDLAAVCAARKAAAAPQPTTP